MEYPAGLDEVLQFSDGSHHSIVTEASKGEVKANVPEREAYECVKAVAVIYFVAGRITMCIFWVTAARRFPVVRIVANDNDALVGALGSELAGGTSGECAAVGTGRVGCAVWSSRVQGHRRQAQRESEGMSVSDTSCKMGK